MPVRGRGIDLDIYHNARVAIATEVSVTATSSATGNTCISTGQFTLDHEGNYHVYVYVPYLTIGSTNLDVELWDGATFLQSLTGHMAASVARPGVHMDTTLFLLSGNHNLTVKAFVDAGTGKFGANNGATGNAPNAYLVVGPA